MLQARLVLKALPLGVVQTHSKADMKLEAVALVTLVTAVAIVTLVTAVVLVTEMATDMEVILLA